MLFPVSRERSATSGKRLPLVMEDLFQKPALLGLNCHCGLAVAGGCISALAGYVVEDARGKIDVADVGDGGEWREKECLVTAMAVRI